MTDELQLAGMQVSTAGYRYYSGAYFLILAAVQLRDLELLIGSTADSKEGHLIGQVPLRTVTPDTIIKKYTGTSRVCLTVYNALAIGKTGETVSATALSMLRLLSFTSPS